MSGLRRHLVPGLVALAAIVAALEVTLGHRASDTTLWVLLPGTLLAILPLLGYRRFPFAAPAAMWVMAAALSLLDGRVVVSTESLFLTGLGASFLLGNLRETRNRRVGLGVVLGAASLIVYDDPKRSAAELVSIPILFALAWLFGVELRERAERTEAAEARAVLAARVAVAEERARIARELHDVVAHAVSVMVLQVGAARHRLPDELAEVKDALGDVERAGRNALTEMRQLLGAMRDSSDEVELTPQPGLGSLTPLLDEVRRAGLPVELEIEGEPFALPPAIDLSAYRIVQEGLTNALKHARASRAGVRVGYSSDELLIAVRDDGRGPATSDGRGHGLIGIQERVKLYGGQVTSGAANGKGFELIVRLPLAGTPS